jgi:hypothetical protein
MHDVVHQYYANITSLFRELTQRWIREGTLAEATDPHALTSLFVTLMPGMIVMSHLYELPTAESTCAGHGRLRVRHGSRSGAGEVRAVPSSFKHSPATASIKPIDIPGGRHAYT